MKYICLFIFAIFVSCNSKSSLSEDEHTNFEELTQDYQHTYMQGSENCDAILARMDENVEMWENGKIWTYSDLKKFCPHLPKKNVIDTYNNQKLLDHNLGYDYVSQLFVSNDGDTIRETASRIWKRIDGNWRIVHMNNLIKKE